MRRGLDHIRGNIVAYSALFFALGGIAGAAAQPLLDKPGSVEGRHIESGAVHVKDLADSVREQVQVTPPATGNFQGETEDGSSTVAALVAGGQVVDMTVLGDCAWDVEGGGFEANGDSWTYVSGGVGNDYLSAYGEFVDEHTLTVTSLEAGSPDVGTIQECREPVTLVFQGDGGSGP